MKKVLLASTALMMMSAGYAAADVAVTGNGRMGVVYIEDITPGNLDELAFSSRLRIVFTASGETDGGLSFGGSIRADNAIGGANGTAGTVFVSMGGMTLTMGDIDSAAENAVGDISGVGYSGITTNGHNGGGLGVLGGDLNETAYLTGGDDEGALFAYTTGGLSFFASAGQPQSANDEYSVGASYTFGTYSVGAGYESKDNVGDSFILGGSAGFGAATVNAQFMSYDADTATVGAGVFAQDHEQYGISLDYVFGATTVTGYYREADLDGAAADIKLFGLGATYDLGGGAALEGGLVNVDVDGLDSQLRADFGITMTF